MFEDRNVGIVSGSPHPGDEVLQRWGALAGRSVERTGEGKGLQKDYGAFGNEVFNHFTHNEVLQAALRFGRVNGIEPTVFLNTGAYPDVLEVDTFRTVDTFTGWKYRRVARYLIQADDKVTRSDLVADTSVSRSHLRQNVLPTLVEKGYVEKHEAEWGHSHTYSWAGERVNL